ncbi:MAG: hypothetical protein FWD62_07635 [Betaproteobacteria bacterium]|nr:hypothetical protein [Betaproteobacteria bacterium]
MSPEMTYGGGWVAKPPVATGGSLISSLVCLAGWAVAASTAIASIGTGGALSLELLQRTTQQASHTTLTDEMINVEDVRTPNDDLVRIREVLNPAVSDLANTFNVSRQSIYNWLNGDPVAEGNAARLQDLAQAADVLTREGIIVNATLLKRKFANGKTLMQVAQAGESARDAALLLVQIHKREAAQRKRMNARFANRVQTPATADFDLPAPSDDA